MTIEKIYLDPNAAAYASLADLDSTAASKLSGIAEGAQVNPANLAALDSTASTKLGTIAEGATVDQTAAELRDAIVGLADDDRQLVISRPTTGQKKIIAIQTHSDGKQEIEQNDTAES